MAEDKEFQPFAAMLVGIVGLVVVMGTIDFASKIGIPTVTPWVPPEGEIIPPGGRAIVYGFVTDALTGEPIPDVKVTLDSLVRYTEWAGQYEIRDTIAGQTYIIAFSKGGYRTITLTVTPIADLNEVSVAMDYE